MGNQCVLLSLAHVLQVDASSLHEHVNRQARDCQSALKKRQPLSVEECVLLEMSHDLVAGHANDAHFVQYFQVEGLYDRAIVLVMSARFPVELNIIHVGDVTEESQVHYLLLDQGHCRPMYPDSPQHTTLAGVNEWLDSQGCDAVKLYSTPWEDVSDGSAR